jgi:hypothetical protein
MPFRAFLFCRNGEQSCGLFGGREKWIHVQSRNNDEQDRGAGASVEMRSILHVDESAHLHNKLVTMLNFTK